MLWLLSALFVASFAQAPKCSVDNGPDISTLAGKQLDYATDNKGGHIDLMLCGQISGIPCGETSSSPCFQIPSACCGVCQTWSAEGGTASACLGTTFNGAALTKGQVELHYVKGDPVANPPGERQTTVTLLCDQGAEVPSVSSFSPATADGHTPNTPYMYNVTVKTSVTCAGGGGDSGGLAGGGIFLILFFVGFAVYFIGGICFNIVKEQKSGKEIIPNLEFWEESPSLFLAGCAFTWEKLTGSCHRESYTTVD